MSFLKSLFDKTPSVAEVDQAVTDLNDRAREIEARLSEINPSEMANGPTLYHQTLTDGSPKDVSELEREYELLKIEARQIEARLVELGPVRDQAAAIEAAKALPGHIKALPALIDEYDAALATLEGVKQKVDNKVSEILQARRAMNGNGRDVPAVPEKIVERIASIRGLTEPESKDRFSMARQYLYRDLAGGKSPRFRGDDDPRKGKYIRGHDKQGNPDLKFHPEQKLFVNDGDKT